jgi:homeobox-leucine zipper protein
MAGAMVVHGGGRDRDRDRSSPGGGPQVDTGKYVRYTPEQVDALERVYSECPKPSSLRRQQLIRECPILSNIEPKQIKVWFQNRRCVPALDLTPSSLGACSCSWC